MEIVMDDIRGSVCRAAKYLPTNLESILSRPASFRHIYAAFFPEAPLGVPIFLYL